MEESAIEMKQGSEKNSSNQKENQSNHTTEKMKSPNSTSAKISPADWLTLVVLTSVNMLNYMDRTLLAGEI